jgi:hypothetical protein
MKRISVSIAVPLAFGIMLLLISYLGSALAQKNTSFNAAGNTTKGNQSDIGTANELERLTQGNTDLLLNGSKVSDRTPGLADLQKEQTTTDSNMTVPSR